MYCNICACKKHETIYLAAVNYGYNPEQFLEELKDFIKENNTVSRMK